MKRIFLPVILSRLVRAPVGRLSVINRAGPILEAKLKTLAGFLAEEAGVRLVWTGKPGCGTTGELVAGFRPSGRLNGQHFCVTIETFATDLVDPAPCDLSKLRVTAFLCVEALEVDAVSGELIDRRVFAVSRRTSPIVAGTLVGSRIVDALLAEIATQVVAHWATLQGPVENRNSVPVVR